DLHLGIAGFDYPDLFKPQRLKDLSDVFDEELAQENPELLARWEAYRRNPGGARSPIEVSALLISISGHVSRFIARLFGVENETAALAAVTADQDPVFRFKIDFVRRRVLPVLKRITVPSDPEAHDELEKSIQRLIDAASGATTPNHDVELRTALAASKLLEADKAFGEKGTPADREKIVPFLNQLGEPSAALVTQWIQSLLQ